MTSPRVEDPLHGRSRPGSSWTTTNVGEAVPGVQTPLGWSIWGPAGEEGLRRAFHTLGALNRDETAVPTASEDRLFSAFYGRIALQLDILCAWADRIPGTSGDAMARQIFTFVPPGYVSRPQRRYYPRVAARAGVPWVRGPKAIRASRTRMQGVWSDAVARVNGLDEAGARALLVTGADEFRQVIYHHTVLTLGAVQPVYDLLAKICAGTDLTPQDLAGGHGGHEETAMVRDLWACSRGRLPVERFVADYGYHGPREGDISITTWREDPTPVHKLVEAYAAQPESENPEAVEAAQQRRRHELEAKLLAATSAARKPLARTALKLAGKYLPLRGVGKVAFLQGVDVTRMAARRLGELAVADGRLLDREDIFFFTLDELRTGWPAHAMELVAERRAAYEKYRTLDLPEFWVGEPEPAPAPEATTGTITGIGASPGVIEGRALVLEDPAGADIEDGDILIARHTDPAWASLMFLSGGLVSDIGGLMSHTAVVARELGIPCVVNTRTAMHTLRTGDRIRVDGNAGTVELLGRTS
ncbi:PEP-utilizing enzyme [Sporichthya polymorpha]|uniref:PEP-utilizing enzyme n=1 Tax=Sporichthya polymorpha TaxID=35751 RepID=UPI000361EA94|nr:PEP-utilizing enzyme [Sporichthya polymorpha]